MYAKEQVCIIYKSMMSKLNDGVKVKNKELLTPKEVLAMLEENGIEIAYRTLFSYIEKGKIPEDLYVVKKKGFVRRYLFKPEVIDFLVEKLG